MRTTLIVAITLWTVPTAYGQTFDAPETEAAIQRMEIAHGGRDAFLSQGGIQIDLSMYLTSLESPDRSNASNWRNYSIDLHPATSRVTVEIPSEPTMGAEVAFDGQQMWATNYEIDPQYNDPPWMLAWYHYAMISLPFIVADEAANITSIGQRDAIGGRQGPFELYQVSFSPSGKIHNGTLNLIIDPQTDRLAGWQQSAWLPVLPGDVLPAEFPASPGNPVRMVDAWIEAGGFIFPSHYSSLDPVGVITGVHSANNISLDPLNEGRLERAENARIIFTLPD